MKFWFEEFSAQHRPTNNTHIHTHTRTHTHRKYDYSQFLGGYFFVSSDSETSSYFTSNIEEV